MIVPVTVFPNINLKIIGKFYFEGFPFKVGKY